MTDSKLAARWMTDDGKTLSEEIVARLLAGRPLTELGLGEHDGRVDLRGLPMPQPQRLQRLNAIAIQQMKLLVNDVGVKKLGGK